MRTFAMVLILVVLEPEAADAEAWIINPDRSAVTFEAVVQGAPLMGRFNRFDANVRFDPDDLMASTITANVDIKSLTTDSSQANRLLMLKDWFAADVHETATFKSSAIVRRHDKMYVASGTLTLRGISTPFQLPFSIHLDRGRASVESVFTLDRTAFQIGQGQWTSSSIVGRDVEVTLSIRAKAQSSLSETGEYQ